MVTIVYNSDMEMMEIKNNDKIVFYGNYWDLNRSPDNLKLLFEALDLQVQLLKTEENMY